MEKFFNSDSAYEKWVRKNKKKKSSQQFEIGKKKYLKGLKGRVQKCNAWSCHSDNFVVGIGYGTYCFFAGIAYNISAIFAQTVYGIFLFYS